MSQKEKINIKDTSNLSTEERLELLEERLQEVEEENTQLRKAIVSLEQFKSDMKYQVEQLNEQIDRLGNDIEILRNRVDATVENLEVIEEKTDKQKKNIEEKHSDISQRITRMEEMLDFNTIETTSSKENKTVIEQFASLPDDVKEEKLNKPMRRATILFNNFETWSKKAKIGKIINSGEIKKLLSTACDTELEWVQVYRVMEAFDEGTPPEYEYKETDKKGKMLIKHEDTSKTRAEKLSE